MAGEAIKQQAHRLRTDATPAPGARNEELRHEELGRIGHAFERALRSMAHHRKTDRRITVEDSQHLGLAICEPARELVRLTMSDLPEPGKDARGLGRQIRQVVAVDALDPAPIIARAGGVSDTDLGHGGLKK